MNTQSDTPTPQAQFPMHELEQIESVIQASRRWLATLEVRRNALAAELERITRPESPAVKPAMKMVGPGFEYRGSMAAHWKYIDIYVGLLRRLWSDFPDRREAMAKAMRRYGITRAYVAKTCTELFPGKPAAWAQQHYRQLVDGWYVDDNEGIERMRRLLPEAVKAAGLTWGSDVKVYWRRTEIPA